MSFTKKSSTKSESKFNSNQHISSSSSSFLVNETDIHEKTPFNQMSQENSLPPLLTSSSKTSEHLKSSKSSSSSKPKLLNSYIRRKLLVTCLIFMYLIGDNLINIIFVTHSFTKLPSFVSDYNVSSSLIDIWLISLVKCTFLFVFTLLVIVRHSLVFKFIRFIHLKYISLVLCLAIYSFAIVKMLLHAETRLIEAKCMAMFIWNFISSFLFYACWYMLKLLKLRTINRGSKKEGDGNEEDLEKSAFLGL
jgi:hypothetical protein